MKYKLPGFILSIFFFCCNIFSVHAQNSNLQIAFTTADSLFAQQECKQARSINETRLSDTSTNSIEWNRLGYCCFQLGDLPGAKKYFTKSLKTNPPPFLK